MFTSEEISRIDGLLREGFTPEDVAKDLGLTYWALRHRLTQAGYRIVTFRALEEIKPVERARLESVAA